MRITADTNLLVRAVTGDDPVQSSLAQAELAKASLVAMPVVALCELAWVLGRGYKVAPAGIADAIRRLTSGVNVALNHKAIEAGLAMLDEGRDFADGVIAFEGAWLGTDTFVSLDRQTVTLLQERGLSARLLA